jgi:hypothetical protein
MPEVEPIVAMPVDPDVQVPTVEASLRVVDDPVQTVAEPVIAAGNGLTVKALVAAEPQPVE